MQSKSVPLHTKLKIYKCAVGSLFTYGSKSWCLNDQCMRKLNDANAVCLLRFTGITRVEESRVISCTYSLVNDIRKRRLVWLGHLLRMNENRLVKRAVREQWRMGERGNLFLDAPKTLNFDQLCVLANDRKTWKALTRALGNKTQVTGPSRTPVRNTRRSSRAQNTEYNEDKLANKCTDQPTSKPAITLSPRAPSFTPTITPGLAAKGLSEAERRAKLYRVREIHYVFFRPDCVPCKKKKKVVKKSA